MPLRFRNIDIPLAGIHKEVDEKLLPLGSLLDLENGYFSKRGRVSKRSGCVKSAVSLVESGKEFRRVGSIFESPSGTLWATGDQQKDDDTADLYDGGRAAFYDTGESAFREAGRLESLQWMDVDIEATSKPYVHKPHSAVIGDLKCTVWQDTSDSGTDACVTIRNKATGNIILPRYVFGTNSDAYLAPKVLVVGSKFVLIADNYPSNEIWACTIDPSDPTTVPALTQIITDLYDKRWDATRWYHSSYGDCYVCAYKTTAGGLQIRWFNNAHTQRGTYNYPTYKVDDFVAAGEITSKTTSDVYLCVVSHDATANEIYYQLWDNTGSVHVTKTNILDTGTYGNAINACFIPDDGRATDNDITFFIEMYDAGGYNSDVYVSLAGVNGSGIYKGIAKLPYAHIVTRPWLINDRAHVMICYVYYDLLSYEETTQMTYFLVSLEGDTPGSLSHDFIVSSLLFPGDGDRRQFYNLSGMTPVTEESTGRWSFPLTRGLADDKRDIVSVTLESRKTSLPRQNHENCVAIGGGLTEWIDGRIQELQMLLYPEVDALVSSSGTGNLANSGAYIYTSIYEWTDREGKLHRSAPAVIKSITLGASDNTVDVDVTTLKHSCDRHKLDNVNVVLYRTTNGGSIFYRVGGSNTDGTKDNDPDADTITFTDKQSDTSLQENPVLYTEGAVFPNFTVLPAVDFAANSEYMFMVPQEDPYRVINSKPMQDETLAPELSSDDLFRVRFSEGGPIKAIECVDTAVVVFKEDSIYAFQGVGGPNAQGVGQFPSPRLISKEIGCVHRPSISQIDAGIVFQSEKGIFMLDRSMSLQHIGEPIDDLVSGEYISVVDVQNSHVVFVKDDAADTDGLVWNYEYNQWSVYSSHRSVDITIHDDDVVRLYGTDTYLYDGSVFTDDGSAFAMLITTPWIKLGGIEGFQRCIWIHLLGSKYSAHTMNVSMFVNYIDSPAEEAWTHTVTVTTPGEPLALRKKPATQKCSALQLTLYDSDQTGTYQSYDLTGLSLRVGVKGRLRPYGS